MRQNRLFMLALTVIFAVLLCTAVAAAEYDYFYISGADGSDRYTGTSPDSPLQTINGVLELAEGTSADAVVIVVMDEVNIKSSLTEVEHDFPCIITTTDGKTDYAEENGAKLVFGQSLVYFLNGDTTFENISMDYKRAIVFAAQYNHLTFGENVTFNKVNEDGGGNGIYVYGGFRSPDDSVPVDRDSHLTFKSGDYYLVVGGSRDIAAGSSTKHFTGTHYMNIEGGTFEIVYGGSHSNNSSMNIDVTVSGGYIKRLSCGGDVSRRLYGDAAVTLSGGEIETFEANNIVGGANVTMSGTKIGSCSVFYYNETIANLAAEKAATKTLRYDARIYSAEQIEQFNNGGVGFDKIENITTVYAKAGASGDGKSAESAASFEAAFKTAASSGATVTVIGEISLDNFTEPSHADTVTVVGYDNTSRLTVSGKYVLAGETEFSAITLGGTFDASTGKLIAEKDVSTPKKINVLGNASLFGGSFASVSDTGALLIDGATVDNVVGGGKSTAVELLSGSIGTLRTADTSIESFSLYVNGGNIGKLVFNNVTKSLELMLHGGTIGACEVVGSNVNGTLTLGDGIDKSMLGSAASLFTKSGETVYFLKDGGSGNGSGASTPGGSFNDAYAAVKDGGTIVICGEVIISESYYAAPAHSGKVYITSLYGGVDYRETAGARIILNNSTLLGGDCEFDHISIVSRKEYAGIFCNYHNVTFGADITNSFEGDSNTYPCIISGSRVASENVNCEINVNGGDWQRIRLGNSGGVPKGANVTFNFNNGTVHGYGYLGSTGSHNGDLTLVVNGGAFRSGIVGSSFTADTTTINGKINVILNGGKVSNFIKLTTTGLGTFNGEFNVTLNGGDFSHMTDIVGTEGLLGDAVSTVCVSEKINIDEEIIGTYTFTTELRDSGADPYLFYANGAFYYTATTGNTVKLYKAANIGDLTSGVSETIYQPESGKEWSSNLWAPEIHYFTEEEAGKGNEGWYLFVGGSLAGQSNSAGMRTYVLKCLDGDDLLGRWGNPITGEENVPERMTFADGVTNVNEFCIDASKLVINGEAYILIAGEKGRDTSGTDNFNFYQYIGIARLENPWTMGKASIICTPEYDWEKVGSGDKIHPMVVEGPEAVYAPDGTVFVAYSGSGYWTTAYSLGSLKYLGGDPLDASSWEKAAQPFFSKSDWRCGTGHASFVTDTNGDGWICYHAYPGKDTSSGRAVFVEPYTASKDGISVGDGKPCADGTTFSAAVNSTSVRDKLAGFDSIKTLEVIPKFTKSRTYADQFADVKTGDWFYTYVKDAYELSLANGTSASAFSPDATFTVAQALTAAVNIHKTYYQKEVRAADAGEKWYTPYVEYCVENSIIKADQFDSLDRNITRGEMATVFANILPGSEYAATRSGECPDVTRDMDCYGAVAKLYNAGIVSGDASSGKFRPNDSIKRSEACVIFTRIALSDLRVK